MKILFKDFNAKVSKEDIFKLTIGNESLHKISNYNGVSSVDMYWVLLRKSVFIVKVVVKYFTWAF
jgi:hypothetical protein